MEDAGRRLPAAASGRWARLHRARELALHLTAREISARRRFTLLGAAWPLARLMAQLGVLLLIFTTVVDLEIARYPAFLFVGLLAWTWFASSLSEGTHALLSQRHLLRQPQCPAEVLPLVAVGTALVDALIALPVLLAVVALSDALHPTALLLPAIAAVQLVFLCALAWLSAAATVYLRDIRELVTVGLMLLFYATPVFYRLDDVPDDYRWALELNPVAILIESYRDVLIEQRLPDPVALGALGAAALALTGLALTVFERLKPGFVDEL